MTALDLATGNKRWDFADRAQSSALVAVAGNAALVFSDDRISYDGVRQVLSNVRIARPSRVTQETVYELARA